MRILLLILGLFFFASTWAQGNRDPFESVLPEREERVPDRRRDPDAALRELPESIILEGVLWGTQKPQAVISGEVYFEGDQVKDLDARIVEIRENAVYILYLGRVFRKTAGGPDE